MTQPFPQVRTCPYATSLSLAPSSTEVTGVCYFALPADPVMSFGLPETVTYLGITNNNDE